MLDNICDASALSSSAARCLARESQMRQLAGAPDGDVRPTSQSQDVLTSASSVHRLQDYCQCQPASSQGCAQPQPRQSMKPALSKVITEAMAAVTERLTWATEELRVTSSIEASCQLCMLIRSCADALQSLWRVDCV